MKCVICEERKPRRYCPGVRGDICPVCCGEERENTISCPLDCVYLQEARAREKPDPPDIIPFHEIRVPDRFLDEHRMVFNLALTALVEAIAATPQAIDSDIREAIEALLQTFKTLQSGLVYETRPDNSIAANIYRMMHDTIEEGRRELPKETGTSIRDTEIFSALLLLQRLEYRFDNGRKRGRAYIGHLQRFARAPASDLDIESPSLIL
jgi:hypothetical protein